MSYDVASSAAASSSFNDSIFDEDWRSLEGGSIGLEAIAEFNASFDDNNDGGACGIDPQLLSNASSPARNNNAPFSNGNGNNVSADYTNEDTSMFDNYPAPTGPHQASPIATPYFHQSIETADDTIQVVPYIPSPLHNQLHRRSVSEPPLGIPSHHFPYMPPPPPPPPSAQSVTFHREGTTIGTPNPQYKPYARSRAKTRFQLQEPYSSTKQRYHLRRSQTQPGHQFHGPTSMPPIQHIPATRHIPAHQQQMMMMQQPFIPGVGPSQYVSSRVCTPTPPPPMQEPNLGSPFHLDPRLSSPEKKEALAIPITVEELRAMITEAVKAAFPPGLSESGKDVGNEGVPVEEDGDEIVVGQVASGW